MSSEIWIFCCTLILSVTDVRNAFSNLGFAIDALSVSFDANPGVIPTVITNTSTMPLPASDFWDNF